MQCRAMRIEVPAQRPHDALALAPNRIGVQQAPRTLERRDADRDSTTHVVIAHLPLVLRLDGGNHRRVA